MDACHRWNKAHCAVLSSAGEAGTVPAWNPSKNSTGLG